MGCWPVSISLPAASREGETQTGFEGEVARLIVEELQLQTAAPDIPPRGMLVGEGLGLDSLDVVTLALAVSRAYGFELKADDEQSERIFASLRCLASHIEAHRTR